MLYRIVILLIENNNKNNKHNIFYSMSSSSSAIPEKILAAANNRRLLVTRFGLAVAIVASLNGVLVVSADQAAVIASAMEVATYNFRQSSSSRVTLAGPELVARTLGVRLQLISYAGSRSNIGPPSEMFFGPTTGPDVKIISLDSKARSQTEYFSFVGAVFNNDLLNQENVNSLLRLLRDDEPHVSFAALLRPPEDVEKAAEAMDAPVLSNSSDNNIDDEVSGKPSLQSLYEEVMRLRQQVTSPMTPIRLGSFSEAGSPMQNSAISNMTMLGFATQAPIYLEKVSSAEVRSFRQRMMMHQWPKPWHCYVHHSIMEYIKGQWNVFAETSKRAIPFFEDSASMLADTWFDTLEEVVAELKNDEEGITAPSLDISDFNGLPLAVESFMQKLWKFLSKQERLHSRPSIRVQLVATLEKCPYARRLAEQHNQRMADEDPQYPPRRLVSKINEIITNLSGAGQHVSDFVKLKKVDTSPKKQLLSTIGTSKFPRSGGSTPFKGNAMPERKVISSGVPKDLEKTVSEPSPKYVLKCHECGKEGHRRGDKACSKYNAALASNKRERTDSPLKANKK